MNIEVLSKKDIAETIDLFCRSFYEDHYYAKLFPDPATRAKEMAEAFGAVFSYCVSLGASLGVRENGKLIGFIVCFDYKYVRDNDPGMFNMIFAGKDKVGSLPYAGTLHATVAELPGKVMYCLSLAVDCSYRSLGIGSAMWDCIMTRFQDACFAADVSNRSSLQIYSRRGFDIQTLDEGYHLISHISTEPSVTFDIDAADMKLIVPDERILQEHHIEYKVFKKEIAVSMTRIEKNLNYQCFVKDENSISFGVQVQLAFEEYLKYQRAINVAHYDEVVCGECVYFIQNTPYTYFPLTNDTQNEMVKTRATEWGVIPDVFVSIPIQYDNTKLPDSKADTRTDLLLRDLDFRTHYEAGVPSSSTEVDDLASFKKRIERYYLGKIAIQITCESTVNQYDVTGEPIGEPTMVDMFLSIDKMGNCGVLTWYSLSAPFLISQLLDNVIRNQVAVVEDGKRLNLFTYLNTTYGIVRRGTPKAFVNIPKDKNCLTNSQIASLLASETIYPDGEIYGEIIDPEITVAVQSEHGMGQYSRAYVAAYTNVVLQFSEDTQQTLRDRLYDESITLFYIELILFEESAINIADCEITGLLTRTEVDSPVEFLEYVDDIHIGFSKTIDFWNIQVNYPTSQKSLDMLRAAFKIDDKLERMKRNQEQLQLVFDTKFDIIDRKDAKRMDKSLAVLSVLAIFSAWMDSYDYVSTWNKILSESTIDMIQKVLFVGILVTAVYTIFRLFAGKTRILSSDAKAKGKGKNRRKKQ